MDTLRPVSTTRYRDVGAATLFYLVIVALSTWAGARRPPEPGSAMLSAAVTAAGTLAMGLLLARRSPYPRWGFLGATGVLAAAALAGPLVLRDPAAWAADVRPMMWMYPWIPMTFGGLRPGVVPGASTSWCSPRSPAAGGLMIAMAALFALITYGAAWLSGSR
jgi:hypothetical protein